MRVLRKINRRDAERAARFFNYCVNEGYAILDSIDPRHENPEDETGVFSAIHAIAHHAYEASFMPALRKDE